jgi:quinol-cytochrome oxidoreductase complex cytochrome b subunit
MSTKKRNFLVHIHPPMIRERTLLPTATFGLGIVCLTCFILLVLTGLTLLLYYVPEQAVAYDRILHIITTLRFGRLVRNLHFHAANALLIAGILHLTRVFLTGSYKGRALNWLYGLALWVLILLNNYTGYLLPWDQTSYWAVRVSSSLVAHFPVVGPSARQFLLGGSDVGPETLLRCFVWHIAALPALWLGLIPLHLWRIRKDGGLAAPDDSSDARIPASPVLFRAELMVAFSTIAVLLALALFFDPPTVGRADPLRPPNPVKAPWYFVGIQEMVSHSTMIGAVLVPVLIALFLLLCPFVDRSQGSGGRWFTRQRLPFNLLFILIIVSQVAAIIVGQFFRTTNWTFMLPW